MRSVALAFIFTAILGVGRLTQAYADPESLVVDGIECVGNQHTDCDIIREEIFLSVNDLIDEEELANARIRLLLRGLFRDVTMVLKKGETRGHVVVRIVVDELSPYFSESVFNGTYGPLRQENWLRLEGGTRNFLGAGQVLSASVGIGRIHDFVTSYSVGLQYQNPHLFGSKRYFLSSEFDGYFDQYDTPIGTQVRRNGTGQLEVGRRFNDFSYVSVGYSYISLQYQDNTGDHSHNGFAAYGWDSRNDPYLPTQGSYFRVSLNRSFGPYDAHNFLQPEGAAIVRIAPLQYLVTSFTGYASFTSYRDAFFTPGIYYQYDWLRGGTREVRDLRFVLGATTNISSYDRNLTYGRPELDWAVDRDWRYQVGVLMDTLSLGYVNLNVFLQPEQGQL